MARDGDFIGIGAIQEDDQLSNSGSAYVYSRPFGVWSQSQKLTASDGASNDNFGSAVDISDSQLVVGATKDDDKEVDSGSAHFYTYTSGTWVKNLKDTAFDGDQYDKFGSAVAVSGDFVASGAPFDDDLGGNSGSVYVTEFNVPTCNPNGTCYCLEGFTGTNCGVEE